MDQRRRYRNPPIEEALCEFRFVPETEWDFTIPGKLQVELGDQYSGKSREQRAARVGLRVQDGKRADLEVGEGLAKVQLVSKEGNRVVGVGPNVLSIHMLRPYQDADDFERGGWEEFEPRIAAALQAYWNVAQPVGIGQVGVRYINKISLPFVDDVRVEEYLTCAHLEIEGLPEHYSKFFSRVEYGYDDGTRLVLSYGLIDTSPKRVNCLLDLDVIQHQSGPIGQATSLDVAGDLHDRAGSAFEAIVTDKARELWDAS